MSGLRRTADPRARVVPPAQTGPTCAQKSSRPCPLTARSRSRGCHIHSAGQRCDTRVPAKMGSVAKAVLLAKAPALARFADEDFDDAAAMAYTSAVLGSGSAASATHQLSEGTQALEGALRTEVLSRHVELLQQVSRCGLHPARQAGHR